MICDATIGADNGLFVRDLSTGSTQLIVSGGRWPSLTRDGKTLVFAKTVDDGQEIWRADSTGGHAERVWRGVASYPVVTPDGAAVMFISSASGLQSVWRVNIDGTNARQFLNVRTTPGVWVSPDGRHVAFVTGALTDAGLSDVVVASADGTSFRHIALAAGRLPYLAWALAWAPDSSGLAYVNASGNIEVQPIAGGPPRQVTRLTGGEIDLFAWSRDGKRLVISRVQALSDVVLLKGVR